MPDLRTLVAAAVALALLVCVGGIVYLAAVPERPVPDVLVALSTGALGYLGGLLVPTTARHRRSEGGWIDVPLFRERITAIRFFNDRRSDAGQANVLYTLLVIIAALILVLLLARII